MGGDGFYCNFAHIWDISLSERRLVLRSEDVIGMGKVEYSWLPRQSVCLLFPQLSYDTGWLEPGNSSS